MDQYDYLPASGIQVAPQYHLTRMANVFPVEDSMILESIVVPTVEVEWITLKDGVAIASLPEVEGCM